MIHQSVRLGDLVILLKFAVAEPRGVGCEGPDLSVAIIGNALDGAGPTNLVSRFSKYVHHHLPQTQSADRALYRLASACQRRASLEPAAHVPLSPDFFYFRRAR